uniref:ATP synthase F0 subunit 8 n=1 Tax=Gynaikothrips uzeli TaxID=1422814 RepID=A0A8A5L9Q7_9NEOP|nr:ATP synthase F0 subunit 8 [Gynaikothrips uzeli]
MKWLLYSTVRSITCLYTLSNWIFNLNLPQTFYLNWFLLSILFFFMFFIYLIKIYFLKLK